MLSSHDTSFGMVAASMGSPKQVEELERKVRQQEGAITELQAMLTKEKQDKIGQKTTAKVQDKVQLRNSR